jgi:esterase/lipase superfamily enzyme
MDTEKACLFLDFLSCPYVEIERKVQVMTNFYKAMKEPTPDCTELQQFFSEKKFPHWFVSWDEIDLLNQLEKKELKQAY